MHWKERLVWWQWKEKNKEISHILHSFSTGKVEAKTIGKTFWILFSLIKENVFYILIMYALYIDLMVSSFYQSYSILIIE